MRPVWNDFPESEKEQSHLLELLYKSQGRVSSKKRKEEETKTREDEVQRREEEIIVAQNELKRKQDEITRSENEMMKREKNFCISWVGVRSRKGGQERKK